MHDNAKLRRFYEQEIRPHVDGLEITLQESKKLTLYFLGSFLVTLGSAFMFHNTALALIGFAITGVLFYLMYTKSKAVEPEYARLVVEPLIKEIDPSLVYTREKGIDIKAYESSMLFPINRKYKYLSQHLTVGKVNDMPITFAQIDTHITKSGDTHSDNTIFSGLFISTKMKKNINATVCIYPDFAEKHFGFLGNSLQFRSRNNLKKITVDNPTFEKEFVVYSDDQVAALYVLTHSMMERILAFTKASESKIYISFQNENVYVGVESYGFLQPMVDLLAKEHITSFENIERHIDALHLALHLSEDLKLKSVA
jgi:hypothetical protein